MTQPTERTRVRRAAKRGHYDRQTIYEILDQTLVCHVGMRRGDGVAVIPMLFWRVDDELFLHGSHGSGLIKALRDGGEACISATILDGLVMARSAFHHSMNYRSVVCYAVAREVTETEEKDRVFHHFFERYAPGRWQEARVPDEQEWKATAVLAFSLAEASAKIRTGPPVDDAADLELPVWAGVVPIHMVAGEPIRDEAGIVGLPCPANLRDFDRYGLKPETPSATVV